MSKTYKQDMPPPGGYQTFNFFRRSSSKPINGFYIYGTLFGTLAVGEYFWRRWRADKRRHFNENNELRVALTPFLIAESQRAYLKHLSNTREAEIKLMNDVPGWETGKWFDYPVFHNPRNLFIKSPYPEYFSQMTSEQQREHVYITHWLY